MEDDWTRGTCRCRVGFSRIGDGADEWSALEAMGSEYDERMISAMGNKEDGDDQGEDANDAGFNDEDEFVLEDVQGESVVSRARREMMREYAMMLPEQRVDDARLPFVLTTETARACPRCGAVRFTSGNIPGFTNGTGTNKCCANGATVLPSAFHVRVSELPQRVRAVLNNPLFSRVLCHGHARVWATARPW